ncbi:VgrG-related protein [Amycolatopsis sp. SID8362]|uniref:VgrG-related protein n=1 Tax=Amycolatopsis sp. SID8362 TaxID=2690346 RepID=UPI00136D8150|nr:VgrG-related protein [Amycolatopsis sp. SID8362]NBH06059.1 VgrG-related protein [Amycolatopsis sp. SID8362]NED42758.1 VgrG-related protein [Amycolatopsis sp. SID8362]
MTETQTPLGMTPPTVRAKIVVGAGGSALPARVSSRVVRTVVDLDAQLPGMFEITLDDRDGETLSRAGISMGTTIEVWGSSVAESEPRMLITGEVTSIEGLLYGLSITTVVRGYTKTHRLQRARRTRTFVNMTDADVAREIAVEAGLEPGLIPPTTTTFEYLAQVNQTDWDFLTDRANEIGYEFGIATTGTFYFRPASTVKEPAHPEPVEATFPHDLLAFRPRMTAGNLPAGVEVRAWDPLAARAVAVPGKFPEPESSLGAPTASSTGSKFTPTELDVSVETDMAPGQYLGPKPSTTAFVVSDRPLANGTAIQSAVDAAAQGLAKQVGSTFTEAEGDAIGNPAIQPGVALEVTGVQREFACRWLITHARHVFDDSEHGYRTAFAANGLQDRSLLGLTSRATTRTRSRIDGVVCGIVSNCTDTLGKGRVKAVLPWLSPTFETDWAPVVQFGAGQRTGSCFLPEVGDEVLLAFEQGDPCRPYVFGGLLNNHSRWDLGGPPVEGAGPVGDVVRRGFVSSSGNGLIFHDELPPPPDSEPVAASGVHLGSKGGELALAFDQVECTAKLTCDPVPGTSASPAGRLSIGATDGVVSVSAGPEGEVTVDGGARLTLKATTSISIESMGVVTIKGTEIRLN